MNQRIWGAILGLLATFAFVLVAKSASPILVLAIPFALLVVLRVSVSPFLGVFGLVLVLQQGFWMREALPVVGITLGDSLVLLTIFGAILSGFREPRRARLGPNDCALHLVLLFAIALALSMLFMDDRAFGMKTAQRFVAFLLLLFLIIRVTTTKKQVELLLIAFVASASLSASVAMLDSAFGFTFGSSGNSTIRERAVVIDTASPDTANDRRAGTANRDPAQSSCMMLAGGALAAILALRGVGHRPLFILASLLCAGGIISSGTRSTLLLLAIGTLWLIYKMRHVRNFRAIVAVGVLSILCTAPLLMSSVVGERFEQLTSPGEDSSLRIRQSMHMAAFEMFLSSPIVGVGPGNFGYHFVGHEYRWLPGREHLIYSGQFELHNMYLAVLVEEGVLGFICFAGLILLTLRQLWIVQKKSPDPRMRQLAESFFFALCLFLLGCLFFSADKNKFTWAALGIGLAIWRVSNLELNPYKTTPVEELPQVALRPVQRFE